MGFRSNNLLAGILFCVLEIVFISRAFIYREAVNDDWLVLVGMGWAVVITAWFAFRASAKRDRLILGTVGVTFLVALAKHWLDPEGIQIARLVGLALWVLPAMTMVCLYQRDRAANRNSQITN